MGEGAARAGLRARARRARTWPMRSPIVWGVRKSKGVSSTGATSPVGMLVSSTWLGQAGAEREGQGGKLRAGRGLAVANGEPATAF